MNRSVRLALMVGALGIASVIGLSASPDAVAREDKVSAEAFRGEMRRLWEDHIVWTRQYIVSAATLEADLPDLGPTADRLFLNQTHIGQAVAPFYGADAGEAVTALLSDHIAIAATAITQAKAGNQAGLEAALAEWYENGDGIAAFLAQANPNSWPFEMMSDHMRDHLNLTLDEAVARLAGEYGADIAAYDAIHAQILEMADMLADGIITQFPNRFSR
jgi:hypothetical protein